MTNEDKKKALRFFQYGMFILTAKAQHDFQGSPYVASTVTWVSQASFEPPLIMLGLRKDSWANEAIRQTDSFALNILSEDQKSIAGKFFKNIEVNGQMINGYSFDTDQSGAPILDEAHAYIECTVTDRIERGDHSIIVASIINAKVRRDFKPILLRDTGWNYGG